VTNSTHNSRKKLTQLLKIEDYQLQWNPPHSTLIILSETDHSIPQDRKCPCAPSQVQKQKNLEHCIYQNPCYAQQGLLNPRISTFDKQERETNNTPWPRSILPSTVLISTEWYRQVKNFQLVSWCRPLQATARCSNSSSSIKIPSPSETHNKITYKE